MQIEHTCALIKPDAVASGLSGQLITLIEAAGFSIVRLEKRTLSVAEAEGFYEMHRARSFFRELVEFMTSGPIIIMVLEKEDAVAAWREFMGATNPVEARVGTLRQLFGTDVGKNATHGSDSQAAAVREIAYWFPQ